MCRAINVLEKSCRYTICGVNELRAAALCTATQAIGLLRGKRSHRYAVFTDFAECGKGDSRKRGYIKNWNGAFALFYFDHGGNYTKDTAKIGLENSLVSET